MRAAVVLLLALVAAGCAAPEEAPPPPPATHATDCATAPQVATCQASTERTPLNVTTEPAGNRSRVGVRLANDGDVPLRFDADPPAFAVYLRQDGAWNKVAAKPGGEAPGRVLAPGEDVVLVLHYGRVRADDRAKDVAYEVEVEEPWPAGTYQVCFSAHPGEAAAWVRGCKAFRIR